MLDAARNAELPWRNLKVVRRDDTPIANGLNTFLVFAVAGLAVGLLWLASWLDNWYCTIGLGLAFSYIMLTNYALMHEAMHLNLHDDLKRNYVLGVISSMFFPVSFTLVQVTHQGHHYRNRTDAEIFDQYYPGRWNRAVKTWQWYGTLIGIFYLLVVLVSVATAIIPGVTKNKLVSGKAIGNGNLADLTRADLRRLRGEMILSILFWGLVVWRLELNLWFMLAMYGMAGINWSTRQYIAHAFSERDVIDGAFNLRHNWLMSKILLNGEWDLNHHRHPDVPWTHLPRVPIDDRERPSYIKQYFRMWMGPVEVTEPEPDMWNTEQMVRHLKSTNV